MTERELLTAKLGVLINSLELRQLRNLSIIMNGVPCCRKNNLYYYGSSVEVMAEAQKVFLGSPEKVQDEMVIIMKALAMGFKIKTD